MKNILIIVIVLILAVVGIMMFTKENTEAPATVEDMDGMEVVPTDIPSGYNTPVSEPDAPLKEFTVEGKNFSFAPATLRVKKGDMVKINFKNVGGFHDFVIDEFKVATSQIKTDETDSVSFLADKTGTFEYYCSVGTHRQMGMKGSLIVE